MRDQACLADYGPLATQVMNVIKTDRFYLTTCCVIISQSKICDHDWSYTSRDMHK